MVGIYWFEWVQTSSEMQGKADFFFSLYLNIYSLHLVEIHRNKRIKSGSWQLCQQIVFKIKIKVS